MILDDRLSAREIIVLDGASNSAEGWLSASLGDLQQHHRNLARSGPQRPSPDPPGSG